MSTLLQDRFLGVIYGTAIGDAYGFPVEFHPDPQGVTEMAAPGLYSDDTQMFRATLEGLMAAGRGASLDVAAEHVAHAYIQWAQSPENNRAPGGACMYGCANLARRVPWRAAGKPTAGGCGAAMRSMAYGLWFWNDPQTAAQWAGEHALMTHQHPMGQASAAAMAAGTAAALSPLRSQAGIAMEMVRAALRYDQATAAMLAQAVREASDFTVSSGEVLNRWRGWAGHEAVAASLFCFLRAGSSVRGSIILAINSPGDSDSLGCMTGALSGGHQGLAAIPENDVAGVEDSAGLRRMGERLVEMLKPDMEELCPKAAPSTPRQEPARPTF